MKYTNKTGISRVTAAALSTDEYDPGKGDYTPSSLNRPPYMARLTRNHEDEIEVDVSDLGKMFGGNATHAMLEAAGRKPEFKDTMIVEERFYAKCGEFVVGPKLDIYEKDTFVLRDYKNTTVFKLTTDEHWAMPDWPDVERQLNIEAWTLRANGFKVEKLVVEAFLTDWHESRVATDAHYPKKQIVTRQFPLWSDDKCFTHISDRIRLHEEGRVRPLENIPECTPEETWEKPTVYALMKEGRKSAVKLNADRERLRDYAVVKGFAELQADDPTSSDFRFKKGYSIVKRIGSRPRCEKYCNVSKFCPAWKKFKAAREAEKAEVK